MICYTELCWITYILHYALISQSVVYMSLCVQQLWFECNLYIIVTVSQKGGEVLPKAMRLQHIEETFNHDGCVLTSNYNSASVDIV